MPYPYLGDQALVYAQYLDEDTGATLRAEPGGSCRMRPAGGQNLPVPPGDGLWGPEPAPAADNPEPAPAPAARTTRAKAADGAAKEG